MEFGSKFAYLNYSDGEESADEEELSAPLRANRRGSSEAPTSAPAAVAEDHGARNPSSGPGFFGRIFGSSSSVSAPAPVSEAAAPRRKSRSPTGRGGPAILQRMNRELDRQRAEGAVAGDVAAVDEPAPAAPIAPVPPQASAKPAKEKKRVVFKKSVPNVFLVKLGTLGDDVSFATGDATTCTKCSAVLSIHSKTEKAPTEENEFQRVWICEFCENKNELVIMDEEIPTEDSLDYIIEPAALAEVMEGAPNIVFCADISGSMCVTTEVPGKLKLKGGTRIDPSLIEPGAMQYLPGQSRNVTYVSRLQCVQAGIDSQLQDLAKNEPSSHVALVTFSSDVNIVGDGTTETEVISGTRLNDQEDLFNFGKQYELKKSIGETRDALSKKLFDLQEQGPTALGPAVVVGLGIASQKPRSRVIVCTDGLANVGLGSVENKKASEEALQYYEKLGETAKAQGVSISVIGIEGSECFMECIGRLADVTGGYVNVVNPLKIASDFANILSDPVVATSVNVKLILHRGLSFEDEENVEGNVLAKSIGNVTRSTEFTFNYSVDKENPHLKELKSLPFQVQIHFVKPDGTKCLRVITKVQNVTTNRQVAEEASSIGILGLHNVRTAAKYAQAGDYEQARAVTVASHRMVERGYKSKSPYFRSAETEEYQQAVELNSNLDEQIYRLQAAENPSGGFVGVAQKSPAPRMHSSPSEQAPQQQQQQAMNLQRQMARGDREASSFMNMKKANRSFMSPKSTD